MSGLCADCKALTATVAAVLREMRDHRLRMRRGLWGDDNPVSAQLVTSCENVDGWVETLAAALSASVGTEGEP